MTSNVFWAFLTYLPELRPLSFTGKKAQPTYLPKNLTSHMNAPEDFANPNTIQSVSYLSREKIFRNIKDGSYPDKNERFTGYIYTDLKSLPVSILRPSICQIIAPCIDLRLNYKIIA